MDTPFRLSEMTWEDVEHVLKVSNPVIILPVGSTEQHGRHLPLGTDSFAAVDLAEAAGKKIERAITAPPVFYGMSSHHMALPGTISIRPEVLVEFTYDVVASLAEHGFNRFILLNGHRVANLPWMQLVCERIHRKLNGCRAVLFDPAYMSREVVDQLNLGVIGHGEEIETSHMLTVLPALCRMDRVEDHPAPETPLFSVDPRCTNDSLVYIPTPPGEAAKTVGKTGGVTGRPSRADARKGSIYRKHLLGRLAEVIEQM